MNIREAYEKGQEKGVLEARAANYSAWPLGLVSASRDVAMEYVAQTELVRDEAIHKAKDIKAPEGLLERVTFELGRLVGSI